MDQIRISYSERYLLAVRNGPEQLVHNVLLHDAEWINLPPQRPGAVPNRRQRVSVTGLSPAEAARRRRSQHHARVHRGSSFFRATPGALPTFESPFLSPNAPAPAPSPAKQPPAQGLVVMDPTPANSPESPPGPSGRTAPSEALATPETSPRLDTTSGRFGAFEFSSRAPRTGVV